MDKYILERDGQLDFYKVFLPRVNPALDIDEILADNNDGVINGNLLEFKLHVTDLNAVLFQCIKYLSALRVKRQARSGEYFDYRCKRRHALAVPLRAVFVGY